MRRRAHRPAYLRPYRDGTPYRPMRVRYVADPSVAEGPAVQPRILSKPVIRMDRATVDWPRFWHIVRQTLTRLHYSPATIALYRQVLRGLAVHIPAGPASVTRADIDCHIGRIADPRPSWTWIAMNISILRSAFDKLGGLQITRHLSTPKRPSTLPTILSQSEIEALILASPTLRDRLLLGLMYGCALKPGEACRLRWNDIMPGAEAVHVRYARNTRVRVVPIPHGLRAPLRTGKARCTPADHVFQGRAHGTHLSTRMAEIILHKAFATLDCPKHISCMTLRHSHAVHTLQHNGNIRELQERLGHASIHSTMRYQSCLLPNDVVSPLESLSADLFQELFTTRPADHPQPDPDSSNPFGPNPNDPSRAIEYYTALKTHMTSRFLCGRRAIRSRGG